MRAMPVNKFAAAGQTQNVMAADRAYGLRGKFVANRAIMHRLALRLAAELAYIMSAHRGAAPAAMLGGEANLRGAGIPLNLPFKPDDFSFCHCCNLSRNLRSNFFA